MRISDLTLVKGAYVSNVTIQAASNTSPPNTPSLAPDADLPIWNANRILNTPVNNAGKADEKVLSYDADSNKIIWSTVASTPTTPTSRDLDHNNNNETLSSEPSYYFVSLASFQSFDVTLPDVAAMINRELTFVSIHEVSEAWFTINGPISGGESYTISGISHVKLLSDGTTWWITST